jgi:hypothetical protein
VTQELLLGLVGLGIAGSAAGLLAVFTLLRRNAAFAFREIPTFETIRRAVSLVVEDGTRLHISLGRGSLLTPFGMPALVGLAMLRKIGEMTSLGDRPPLATSGDGLLQMTAQETLVSAHEAVAVEGRLDPLSSRMTGPTPFSYAAGTLPAIRDEQISTNIFIGNFGVEVGLLAEAAERQGSVVIAASDNLPAQAVLFATAPGSPIGEELFAAGAYTQAGTAHEASVRVQDVLRLLLILALVAGAILKWLVGGS